MKYNATLKNPPRGGIQQEPKGPCHFCGKAIAPGDSYTKHLGTLSAFGKTVYLDYVELCQGCCDAVGKAYRKVQDGKKKKEASRA